MNSNERNCDKCVYGRRSGNCTAWNCKGTVTVEDIKAEARKSAIDLITELKNKYEHFSHEEYYVSAMISDLEDLIEDLKENNNG